MDVELQQGGGGAATSSNKRSEDAREEEAPQKAQKLVGVEDPQRRFRGDIQQFFPQELRRVHHQLCLH